ncbi:Muscle M line assembly protein unc 89 [Trichuris trichiura]|uniref:Muscle M line assembly protein unc 89 n=1 Tax=Trichuris trichiura TaxID=36087 RepID=A0A077Z7M3_TRITR|nr:Muscle M line assembly protein unc 89 [Trichuris trichiura]
MNTAGYTSKYSSYRKYITSSEVAYDSSQRRSTYSSSVADEYSSSRGVSSSRKEIISGTDTHSLPVYIATQDYQPEATNKDGLALEEGQIVEVLDNKNTSSWLVRTKARPPKIGWAPGTIFEVPTEYYRLKRHSRELSPTDKPLTKIEEALLKRNAVFQDLMKSEETFVSELHHLLQTYLHFLDCQSPPPSVRQLKDQLSLNLREIYNFHANVLLKGFQYYSNDPGIVGQTFMRLERDFDHHVRYCHDEPETEKLLEDPVVREYFEKAKEQIETSEKTLLDYLRLPIKRILDYQQALKEMIRYSITANVPTDSLQRALELMLWIPKRASDLNLIRNILDLPTETAKLGRLLRHEQFEVWQDNLDGPKQQLHVFLFKTKIVATERIEPEDPDEVPEFKHVFSMRLDKYDIKKYPGNSNIVQFVPVDASLPTYFFKATATDNAEIVKQAWIKDVQENRETTGELPESEVEVQGEFIDFSDIKSEFSEYSSVSRKSSEYGDGRDDESPPAKKPKTPPAISRSTSAQSVYSMNMDSLTQTGSIEMEGSSVTRTQYGFRTVHETTAKMSLKVTGNPMPVITWYKDGVLLQEDERKKFYSDDDGYFALTIEPVQVEDTGRYTCVATNEYGQARTSAFFRVVKVDREPEPPKFLKVMRDLELHEGDTAVFTCEVEGWPEPEIQFYLDGQPIHISREHNIEYDGRTVRLTVREVQPEDGGSYMLKAVNGSGEVQCAATLTVIKDLEKNKMPPYFQQQLNDVTVVEDQSVKFKTVCSGDPTPEAVWYINGVQLTNSDKVHMIAEDGVYILTIDNITQHFDGELTCCAFNRLGEISCSCRITVNKADYAPSFEQELSDQVVTAGENVKLQVVIAAQPEATVSWWFNDEQISEHHPNVRLTAKAQAGNYTIEIMKATTDMCGVIKCQASNYLGTVFSSANLSVEQAKSAPTFTNMLQNIVALPREHLKIQVSIIGCPRPTVVWKLNGQEIKESPNIKISSSETDYYLEILSFTENDAGELECTAANSLGTASSKCLLSKSPTKVESNFEKELPESTTAEGGQPVSFSVRSKQSATFSWFLNGRELHDGDNGFRITAIGDQESRLIIESFSESLSGKLTCVATSPQGVSETSTDVKSTLGMKEGAGPLPPTVLAEYGGRVLLKVTVESDQAEVCWRLNGELLKNGEKVHIGRKGSDFFLEIEDIDDSASGELLCEVRQGTRSDTFGTNIKVERRALTTLLDGLKDTSVCIGDTVQFNLSLKDAKRYEVKWLLNDHELVESENVHINVYPEQAECSLKIENITEEFNGELKCNILTPSGDYVSSAQLQVVPRAAPVVVKGLSDSFVQAGDTVKFSVSAENAVEGKVRWVLNGSELLPSDSVIITTEHLNECSLTLKNINPEQSGILECLITTPYGVSRSSAKLTVKPLPAKLMKPEFRAIMAPVVIYEGDTLETRVVLEGEPQPEVKWYINDVLLVEDSNVEITTEKGISKVEIKKVNFDLNGTLKCVAKNEYGEVATSTSVSICRQIPVEFEQFLCDTTCREGDTLKLKAVLLGQPRPEVSWYLKGKKLVQTDKIHIYTEQNTYVAVISDITCDYSGEVLCKAVNEFGEASSSAMLTVLPRGVPPDFLEWMNSISAVEGAEVVHHVKFTGEPKPTIRWFINNQEVHNSDNFVIHTEKDVCTLTIKHFSASLAGEIICKAENDAGEVSCTSQMSLAPAGYVREEVSERSELEAVALSTGEIEGSEAGTDFAVSLPDEDMEEETSRLESSVLAPKFITKIKDTRVTVGKQAVFECIVPGTKGVCVKWLKDNKEIELLARIRVGSHKEENVIIHRLTVDDVTKADAGTYTCVVMNEHGQEICSAKLEVDEQWTVAQLPESVPEIVEVLHSCIVEENEEAIMHCTVTGCPDAQVRWYKDNVRLESSERHEIVSEANGVFVLKILNVTMKDAGEYKCEVFNASGVASSTATLTVTVPMPKESTVGEAMAPKFVEPLIVSEDAHKKITMFTCKISGQPRPQVRWFKNEKMLSTSYKYEIINEEQDAYILKIHDTTTEDNGEYRCEAFNENGIASSSVVLTMKFEQVTESTVPESAPEFSKPLTSAVLNSGEALHLECTVVGQPAPSIQWYKSEEELRTTETITITSFPNGLECLDVNEATPSDSGDYRCIATNRVGYASSEATVTVHAAEEMETGELLGAVTEFVEPLHSQTVKENETGTLSCKVIGPPVTSVRWFKEDMMLESSEKYEIMSKGDGVFALQVHNSTAEDSGEFKCEVTTEKGSSTSKAQLTVEKSSLKQEFAEEQPPEFLKSPTATSLTEGESLTLECSVTGKPRPTVQWFRNGEEIEEEESVKLETGDNGVCRLTVHNVTQKDAGQYRCIATNTSGASWSDVSVTVNVAEHAVLTPVFEAAPIFVQQLQSCTVNANEQHILQCRVTGAPQPQVRWLKDGVQLQPSEKYEMICEDGETQILKVQNFNEDDSAVYRCEASNAKGFAASEASIKIQKAEVVTAVPTFSETLVATSVVEGQPLLLECTVSGEQDAIVEWFKNDQRIDATQNVKIESLAGGVQHLEVRNVTLNDSGIYRCVVANELGDSSTEARVTVQTHETVEEAELCETVPVFVEVLKSQVAKESEVSSLTCKVYSSPKTEVQWFKDGVELKSSEKYELINEVSGVFVLKVHDISKQDAGEYTCVATNKMGSASSNAFLSVSVAEETVSGGQQMAPAFLSAITEAFPMCGEKVHLECVVTGNPPPEVHWLKNGQEVLSTGMMKVSTFSDGTQCLEIEHVAVKDAGDYCCVATNPLGQASTKIAVDVKTAETEEDFKLYGTVPQFLETLHHCDVKENETAIMKSKVIGTPLPEVRWYKDNELLESSAKFELVSEVDGSFLLKVHDATEADVGEYRCEIFNSKGVASSKAQLTVRAGEASETISALKAPLFLETLTSCSLTEGEPLLLNCAVSGQPTPIIQWFKNGEEVKATEQIKIETLPEGILRLVVQHTHVGDSGLYRCLATNEAGKCSTEATVSVQGNMKEYKRGYESGALKGTTLCHQRNDYGDARKGGACETMEFEELAETAPEFVEVLHFCDVAETQEGILSCKLTGIPKPEVQWFKDGVPIEPSEKYEMVTDESGLVLLKVHAAGREDSGEYRCEASNSRGVAWTEAPLNVKVAELMEYEEGEEVAPDFLEPVQACVVNKGEDAMLICRISGVPTPQVCWYKNGMPLVSDERVEITSFGDRHKLVVHNAQQEDVADYRCEAKNDAGVVCISFTGEDYLMESVQDETAPFFVREIQQESVNAGDKAVLTCQVSGNPTPEVHWYRDGKLLDLSKDVKIASTSDGTVTLVIQHARVEDQGNYRCEAVNILGSACSKAPLSVFPTEEIMEVEESVSMQFTEPLHHYMMEKDTVAVFECKLKAQPVSTIVWYKDGAPIQPDNFTVIESLPDGLQRLTLKCTTVSAAGHYACLAKSDIKEVKTEDDLLISKEPLPLEFLQGLKRQYVKKGDTVTMRCQVNMKGRRKLPTVKWYKSGRELLPDKRVKMEASMDGWFTLTLTKFEENDAGMYTCIISENSSLIKSEAPVELTVTEKGGEFSIVKELGSQTITAGEKLELELVTSESCDAIRWLRNDEVLINDKRTKIEQPEACVCRLTIAEASLRDQGNYSAIATKGNMTLQSQAKVIVIDVQYLNIIQQVSVVSVSLKGFYWFIGEGKHLEVTKPLEDVAVPAGAEVTLEVQFNEPIDHAQWYLDSKELVSDAKVSLEQLDERILRLHLKNADRGDAGLYAVVAHSGEETTECKANLSVQAPQFLTITKGLGDVLTELHKPLTLTVNVDGLPESVEWLKDGEPIKEQANLKIEVPAKGVYRLAFSDTLADSAGLYTFRAIDETGVIESSGTLSVVDMAEEPLQKMITKLAVVEGLVDQAVAERSPVCLRIKLNKKPKVVKWYKNGKEIIQSNKFKAKVDETSASLEISSLSAEDSGVYEVVASDERDSVASSGKLCVTSGSQLNITRGLEDTTVMKGTELTLEVELSKPAQMAIWYHGNEKLANSENLRLEEIDGRVHRLHVQHADIQDSGEYRVVVQSDGEKAESKANIKVDTTPNLRITKELQDVSPTLHETVIMEVQLEGLPENVEWLKNGSKLVSLPGMRIEVGEDGWHRLILEDVLPDSAGLYKFRASSPDSSVESSGTVILKQPVEEKAGDAEAALTLVKGLEDQTVEPGNSISLSVKLNKRPKDIKWYSNGKEVLPSKRKKLKFDGLEATLEVDKASEDDGGIYEVVATDETTTIRSSGNVRIVVPTALKIISGLKPCEVTVGEPLTLSVQLEGNADVIEWLKDGVKLTNVPNYSFTCTEGLYNLLVKQAEMENAGEYTFTAKKANDAVSSVGAVVVKSPRSEKALEQPEKLAFVKGLEDQQLQEGDELKLKVQTNKKPMTVKWLRNGTPVTSTGGTTLVDNGDKVFELIVENASQGDAGSYKVIIGDEHVSAESMATVVVAEKAAEKPLKVVKGMADLTCDLGSKAYFEVEISGKPKSYRWYKNGREVKQTPRISLKELDSGRYRLEIEKTDRDDGGEFSFEAENSVGKVRSQALLTVQSPAAKKDSAAEPLVITRPLDNQKAEEGAEISFEAEFNKKPKEVHWYKGMDVVTGNERIKISSPTMNASKLDVIRVSPEDSSSYRIEAVDDLGNVVTSTANLIVNASPERLQFIKPMADVQVAKGDTATLEVQVKGIPQSVKWYKNGRLLTSQGRQQEIGKGTYVLKIPDASNDDQGLYKCELENQLGSIATEGTLVVLPLAEEASKEEIGTLKVLKGLPDLALYVGDDLLLEVELSSKPEEVLWFNNGHPVPANKCEVENMPNGHALCRCRLPNIDISNDGTFTVKARNPYSSVDSSNKLTVKGKPPKILRGLEDRRASPGNRVVFEIEVDRKPKLVKWYKNGRLVKESARTVLITADDCTYQLVINDVDKQDLGNYSVEVSNDFGIAKSDAKLSIIELEDETWHRSPKIVKPLNDLEIFEGNHATFSVTVEGKPKSVTWYRNGVKLTSSQGALTTQLDDSTYKLTLRECHKDDTGLIKVLAMNDFGSDTSEGKLIVKEIPMERVPTSMEKAARFVIPLEDVTTETSKKVVLSCKVEGVPTPVIKWFVHKELHFNVSVETSFSTAALAFIVMFSGFNNWVEFRFKDGKEIDQNERLTYSIDEDKVCSLFISAITPEDEGCYAALAKNSLGQDRTECNVTVAVASKSAKELEHGAAPEFIKPLRSKSIIEGEDLTLDARIIGNPIPEICWFVDGKVVEPTERVQGKIECIASEVVFRLVIKSARLSDAANYKCVATNKYGTKESEADITIEVLKPADLVQPKFVIPLSDLHVVEGETLRAEVKIRGRPVPTLSWFCNKTEVAKKDRLSIEELGDNRWLFTLKDARPEDSGFYECVATNSMGSDVSQAYFTVKRRQIWTMLTWEISSALASGVRREKGANFYPPVFNVPLHDRCLPEKATMTIECYVDANPTAKIQWYKGDLLLDDDAHVQTENYPDGKCRLRINFFSSGDVGYYRCIATNELGSATTSAYLSMEVEKEGEVERRREYAPYFTKALENVRTCVGKPLVLECNVAGIPFPEIRWYKDGMMVFGQGAIMELFEDGKCRLKIEKISDKDVGAYRCVASNVHGSSSCACTVGTEISKEERREGREPPVILKGLTDLWAEKGDDLEFKCEIAGSKPLEIKWYKDGVLLRPSERLNVELKEDGVATLLIHSCKFADEGMYRLLVENSEGSAHSMCSVIVNTKLEKLPALVLPTGAAPTVIIPLENQRQIEGNLIELACQFSGEPTHIRWYKDGQEIGSDGHVRIEFLDNGQSRLSIKTLMLKDEGSYRCVASNEFGSSSTKCFMRVEGEICVFSSTSFCVPLRNKRALEFQDVHLECTYSSAEIPKITWLKDGDELSESDRIKMETFPDGKCRLSIFRVTSLDDGLYRCVAEDSTGTANTKSRLTVKPVFADIGPAKKAEKKGKPPLFIEPLRDVKSAQGEAVRLVCQVQGDPSPSIRWMKDGDRVYNGGKYSISFSEDGLAELIIQKSTTLDSGCYRCVAENEYGSARTLGTVKVTKEETKALMNLEDQIKQGRAPGFIHPLTVKRITAGGSVVLECLPYGNPFPDIRWLKDGVEISPSERIKVKAEKDGWQRLFISDALLSDDGFYRCVASNDFGTNSTKAELIVEEDLEKQISQEPVVEPELHQKPRFKQGLESITIHKGSPAEFECFPIGIPYPDVQWFKNGNPLMPSSRVVMWKDHWGYQRLVILNADLDDMGEYKCQISNAEGSAVSEGSLTVLFDAFEKEVKGLAATARSHREFADKPEIALMLRHLKNKHAFSGFPVIFDCLVKGPEAMEVQWFHNGKPIDSSKRVSMHYAGGGSYALVIQHAEALDGGEYVVEFRSPGGVISSSAVLDVTVPRLDSMSIEARSNSLSHRPYEMITRKTKYVGVPTPPDRGPFIAEVTGHFLTLSWIPTKRTPPRYSQVTYIVEMRELPYKEWYVVDFNIPQPCCKIRNMEHGKSYQFRVRAENLYGISDPSPPSPPSQLMAPPQPVLDKNNRPIPLLDPYAQNAIQKVYGEQYACAPWFSPMKTKNFYCASQGKVTVALQVHGYPTPRITWYFRGLELNTSLPITKYDIRNCGAECSLTISAFTKEDVGQYQCRASNDNGDALQDFMIDIAVRPCFIQPLRSKVVKSGNVCSVTCQIDGTPMPDIKWFKDWKPLYENNRIKFAFDPPSTYSLIIETPLSRDTGVYTCVASNEAGKWSRMIIRKSSIRTDKLDCIRILEEVYAFMVSQYHATDANGLVGANGFHA